MTGPVASLLSRARVAYRSLPVGLRMRVGRNLRMVLEPALARSLESAGDRATAPAASANILGLFGAPLGHAQAARLCAQELTQAGLRVGELEAARALGIGDGGSSSDLPAGADATVFVLNPDSLVHALVQIDPARVRTGRRVGYWVWELETAPARWRPLGERLIHDIWAPSQFSATALERVFERPVKVVPHPSALAQSPIRTAERRARARARHGLAEGAFVALTSFAFTSSMARKNPLGAIEAFRKAVDGRVKEAVLMIRCLKGDLYPAARRELRAQVSAAGGQVRLLEDGDLVELHDLYAAADCYVSLHRSEGFGLNLAEAMLCGLPVVATGWSGNLDFMDDRNSALVAPRALVPVVDPQNIYAMRGAVWADPDMDAAVEQIRRLAMDRDAGVRLGETAQADARVRLAGGAAAAALRQP